MDQAFQSPCSPSLRRALFDSFQSYNVGTDVAFTPEPDRICYLTDNAKTIHLKANSIFEIHLAAQPSRGNLWSSPVIKGSVKLLRASCSQNAQGYCGRNCTQVFRFQTSDMGESKVMLRYQGESVAQTFTNHFTLYISVSQ